MGRCLLGTALFGAEPSILIILPLMDFLTNLLANLEAWLSLEIMGIKLIFLIARQWI